jgi:hypothetical protein
MPGGCWREVVFVHRELGRHENAVARAAWMMRQRGTGWRRPARFGHRWEGLRRLRRSPKLLRRVECGEGLRAELKHERHRDQLLHGHDRPIVTKKFDQGVPAQARGAVHLRIATKQLVERVFDVTALDAIGVKHALPCIAIAW